METVKVSWSGGKDSTCALMMHLEAGHKVKAVCYVPMLTDDIPLILKNHYEFILRSAERFRERGADVYIVNGMTYYDFVLHKVTRGVRKGSIFGFPCFLRGKCNFRNYGKECAVAQADVGCFDYNDIGIAADETDRQNQLSDKKRSILVESGYTELDAMRKCEKEGFLSPHYADHKRDGCALCPQAKAAERQLYFTDYPEAFEVVMELQNIIKSEMELGNIPYNHCPLRGYKWFIEEDFQLSLFDKPGEIKYIIN